MPRARPARDVADAAVEPLLTAAAARLGPRAGDAATARLEAELLLAHAWGCSRAALLGRDRVPPAVRARFDGLLGRRVDHALPVAYLLGRRAFRDLDLDVDARVLVPRPETELLVDLFEELQAGGRLPAGPVADVGTGSGNIALAVCARRPVLAVELSADALEVARGNAARHGSGRGLLLLRGDGLDAVASGVLAAVLSNPPYVEPHELAGLPEDVARHEPRGALVPGVGSGAEHYARLRAQAARVLVPGGWWLTEVGCGQAAARARELVAEGWGEVTRRPDLAGIERVVAARRPD